MNPKYESEPAGQALEELCDTVAKLRAPDGCPWDRAQTHESLKAACVEEAAEVVSGINILSSTGKPQSLREELGDLLLQVIMHAQIAEEEGFFTLTDVIHGINQKMIRRHPHVFGDTASHVSADNKTVSHESTSRKSDLKTIPADWKKIKATEKKGREWEEAYLFEAFDEAENLITVARERKKQNAKGTAE